MYICKPSQVLRNNKFGDGYLEFLFQFLINVLMSCRIHPSEVK